MDEKTQIGIAILPPEEYSVFVRQQEVALAKKYNTVQGLLQPPHITIKWPFSVEKLEPFERYCESLAKEMLPFEIGINGYGFFEPKVIFLKVSQNERLVGLHLKIISELKERYEIGPNAYEGKNQIFHTTLAYEDISEENFYRAKRELEGSAQPKISFTFDSIGLFRFNGAEWTVHKRYFVGRE